MSYRILLVLMVFYAALFAACESSKSRSTPEPLTAAEYQLADFPDTTRPWKAADFGKAVRALERLKEQDDTKLPRLHEGLGAAAMQQLTDFNQYSFLDTAVQDDTEQFEALSETSLAIRTLTMLYAKAPMKNGRMRYGPEIMASVIATMWNMEQQMKYAEKMIASGKLVSDIQQKGLQQMRTGLAIAIRNILNTLEKENHLYEAADIEKLANYFFPLFNRVKHFMHVNDRNELNADIKRLAEEHENPAVRVAAKQV